MVFFVLTDRTINNRLLLANTRMLSFFLRLIKGK